MTSAYRKSEETTAETYELMEKVRRRIKQKKRLYFHFVFFLVGSVFLIIINKVLHFKEEYNWFVWAIVLWTFLLIIHVFNVYVTHKFLGKEWEQRQREKLIEKQRAKIAEMEQEVKAAFPSAKDRNIPPLQ